MIIIEKAFSSFDKNEALNTFKTIYPEEEINDYWLNDYDDSLVIQVADESFYLVDENNIKYLGFCTLDQAKENSFKENGKEL